MARYERNVYVGLSGPYSDKEQMVRAAIVDCARTILLEQAVALDSRIIGQWDSERGDMVFASDAHAYYDDTLLASVIDRLDILSVRFDREKGAVVAARDPQQEAGARPWVPVYGPDGRPSWLDSYPVEEGYRFGLGSSPAYRFVNDSVEAADFLAAQDLLDRYQDNLFAASATEVEDAKLQQTVYQHARSLLQGFSIVSRYHDRTSDTYWSLAAVEE
jgi:hypothetical protein